MYRTSKLNMESSLSLQAHCTAASIGGGGGGETVPQDLTGYRASKMLCVDLVLLLFFCSLTPNPVAFLSTQGGRPIEDISQ